MDAETTSAHNLEINRVYDAERARVFRAWTEPDAIKQWFGPESCSVLDARVDLRVDGEYHFKLRGQEIPEIWLTGVFKEITPPEKLVYTWKWLTEPMSALGETLVTVEFLERGEKTEVKLTHTGFSVVEAVTEHNEGWSGTLDRLAAFLTG